MTIFKRKRHIMKLKVPEYAYIRFIFSTILFMNLIEIVKGDIDPGVWVPGKIVTGGTVWSDYDKGHQTSKEKCDSHCKGQSTIGVETKYFC
jgi:hypothetical protein